MLHPNGDGVDGRLGSLAQQGGWLRGGGERGGGAERRGEGGD